MTQSLTVGQILALNHTMSEYPMQYDFDTLFNMIYEGSPEVTVYSCFEDWNTSDLHDFVKCLAEDIDKEIDLAMK